MPVCKFEKIFNASLRKSKLYDHQCQTSRGTCECYAQSLQSCVTLFDPMDCSPPSFSVRGILRARIPEWVAFPSSGDCPNPGFEPVSSALQADSLPTELLGKPSRNTWENKITILGLAETAGFFQLSQLHIRFPFSYILCVCMF